MARPERFELPTLWFEVYHCIIPPPATEYAEACFLRLFTLLRYFPLYSDTRDFAGVWSLCGHFFERGLRVPTQVLRQDTVRTIPYVGSTGSQCVYWDRNLPGFGVRVYPSGKRTYVCSYRVEKRKRLAKLGRADVLTLDQARRKAKEYLGQVAADRDPLADRDAKASSGTVKDLVDAYVIGHAKPKKVTWKQDASTLQRNLVAKLGTRLAATVTSGDIQSIHLRIGAKHTYAANTFVEVVRKMFNWACVASLLPQNFVNPTKGIVFFPRRKRKRYITRAEMPRFLQAIEYEDNEYARHAVWLLLLTGVRVKELLRANWEHIDWEMKTLFVGHTKNGEPILVPLSDAAIARLKQISRIEGNPHIICGKFPGEHLKSLRYTLLRIRASAQMPDIRIHDIRRTVGSWLVQGGETLHLVGQVLNHQDTKTTAGYAYFQTLDRERALTAHAAKVLSFAGDLQYAGTLPLPPEPASLPPRLPLEAIPPKGRSYYLTREQLHALVWERPVSEVARRFGISDVGLSKICRRASIPTPQRGYWARLDGGQDVRPTPLPAAPRDLPGKIRIRAIAQPSRASCANATASVAVDAAMPR